MGNEQMQVEFHEKAAAKLFSVLLAFEKDVSSVSRRHEEFRFQQIKKQYASTLEQELQTVARDILAKHKSEAQSVPVMV